MLACVVSLSLALSGCSSSDASTYLGRIVTAVRAAIDQDAVKAVVGDKKRSKEAHLVELATVKLDTLHLTSVYTGSLKSRRTVRIHSQEEGRILSLPYFEGDAVAAGAVLLTLDDTLLQAELAKTVAVRRETEATLARLNGLRAGQLIPEDEFLRAGTAVEVAKAEEVVLRTRAGYMRVTAPFAGVVSVRVVEPGDIVERHSHVLTLIDPSVLVSELEVSELLIPHLSIGQRVGVHIDALGDHEFDGVLLRIHPELNPRTRNGRVEVKLEPPPENAKPGQFARVAFSVEALGRKVAPFSALRRDRDGEFVFRFAAGKVERVAVRSGRRLADKVEILEGVADGEQIVIRGFLGLTNGMSVEPTDISKASSG